MDERSFKEWLEEQIIVSFGDKLPAKEIVSLVKPVALIGESIEDERDVEVESIIPMEIPEVGTMCEAYESGCNYFLYAAHADDYFLVCDIRYLEWLKKVSNPLSTGNYWEPEITPKDVVKAQEYLEQMAYPFRSFGFEPSLQLEGTGDLSEEDLVMAVIGLQLAIEGCHQAIIDAVIIWLTTKNVHVAKVEYGSYLHQIWLGFVGD